MADHCGQDGGAGAKGTQKEFDAIVDYLATTYPGEEVPKIKVNEARAVELESGLSLPVRKRRRSFSIELRMATSSHLKI